MRFLAAAEVDAVRHLNQADAFFFNIGLSLAVSVRQGDKITDIDTHFTVARQHRLDVRRGHQPLRHQKFPGGNNRGFGVAVRLIQQNMLIFDRNHMGSSLPYFSTSLLPQSRGRTAIGR
ncbi:hypothetical protein SDC9_149696 [bioreactor metagenome]|uniref:Uncharacterized protein n=1 Tax=bioreactor metagenome TaxID=1076179 RepID=A0A645EM92_9ZZZZ